MDDEIDEWFKLEEEKLQKKFFETTKMMINEGTSYEEVREKFIKQHKKLISGYENRYYGQIKREKWKKLLRKPISKLNEGMDEFVKAFREE